MRIKKPDDETLEYIRDNYIYDPSTGQIDGPLRKNIGEIRYTQHNNRYLYVINIKGRKYRRYHLAWFLYHGAWPRQQIDHKDRNSLNDVITNLQEVDDFKQQQNKENYSGYRDFSILKKNDGKWRAKNLVVRNQARGVILGYVKDIEEGKKLIDQYWEGFASGETKK